MKFTVTFMLANTSTETIIFKFTVLYIVYCVHQFSKTATAASVIGSQTLPIPLNDCYNCA